MNPEPPENYRLLTDEEKTEPLPEDTMYWANDGEGWQPSFLRGGKSETRDGIYATRLPACQKCHGFGWIRVGDPGMRCDCKTRTDDLAQLRAELEKAHIRENHAVESYEESELSAIKLRAELARVTAERDAARRDSARLEAIIRNKWTITWNSLRDSFIVQSKDQVCGNIGHSKPLRELLDDAAMQPKEQACRADRMRELEAVCGDLAGASENMLTVWANKDKVPGWVMRWTEAKAKLRTALSAFDRVSK